MSDTDGNDPLVIQFNANIRAFEAQMNRMNRTLEDKAVQSERRAKTMAERMNKSLGEFNPAEAFEKTFNRARFAVFEEGGAKVGVFGNALEALGPAGLVAAGGLAAVSLAMEKVTEAAEQIGALAIDSKRFDIPVEDLQRWQFIAASSHVTNDQLNASFEGMSVTLGKLRSGIRDQRIKPFLVELGLSEKDLAGVQNAGQLIDLLIERMDKLKIAAPERNQIAEAFGGAGIINILSKSREEVQGLTEDFRKSAAVISGEQAEAIEKQNQKLEEQHAIIDTKIKRDLAELAPAIGAIRTAWDVVLERSLRATEVMLQYFARFGLAASGMRLPETGGSPNARAMAAGANAAGAVAGAVLDPGALAQRLAVSGLRMLGIAPQQAVARPAPAPERREAEKAVGETHVKTGAQIEAEQAAAEKLGEMEARLLTHTQHRLEAEKQIAALNKSRAAAGLPELDKATTNKLLAAAAAEDSKAAASARDAASRKAAEAQRKAAEAAKKAQEETDKGQEMIDSAAAEEIEARKALATSVQAQNALEQQVLRATRDKALAALKAASDRGEVRPADAAKASGLVSTAFDERSQRQADLAADQIARQVGASQRQAVQSQIEELQAQESLASTTEQRRAMALRQVALQEQLEEIALQEVIASKTASDADRQLAQQKLGELRAMQPLRQQEAMRSTENPGEAFRRELNGGSFGDDLQTAEVSGIKSMGDQLDAVALKSKSAKAALHDLVQSVLADMLKIATQRMIEQPLANMLFGSPNQTVQGSGGAGLNLFTAATSVAKFFGFADGGKLGGSGGPRSDNLLIRASPGEYVVNAKATERYGGLLEAINKDRLPKFADGGVIGFASAPAAATSQAMAILNGHGPAGTTVHQHFHLDARGAVMTEDLVDQMKGYTNEAVHVGSTASAVSAHKMTMDVLAKKTRYQLR